MYMKTHTFQNSLDCSFIWFYCNSEAFSSRRHGIWNFWGKKWSEVMQATKKPTHKWHNKQHDKVGTRRKRSINNSLSSTICCVCIAMETVLTVWWVGVAAHQQQQQQRQRVDVIYARLFGRTKKSCDKNLIAQRIIKFCAKLNSKRQASYKSLQRSGLDCFIRWLWNVRTLC